MSDHDVRTHHVLRDAGRRVGRAPASPTRSSRPARGPRRWRSRSPPTRGSAGPRAPRRALGGVLALGLGLASGRPAVVLCTSGTAAVELHPAVVEAHQAGVPLLVCTADRPPELRDVGGAPDDRPDPPLRRRGALVRRRRRAGRRGTPARGGRSAARAVADARRRRRRRRARCTSTCRSASRSSASAGPLPAGVPTAGRGTTVVGGPSPLLDERRRRPGRRARQPRGVIVAGGRCAAVADGVHALAARRRLAGAGRPRVRVLGCRRRTTVAAFDALLRHPAFAADHRPTVRAARSASRRRRRCSAQWLAASRRRVQVAIAARPGVDRSRRTGRRCVVVADPDAASCRALAKRLRARPPARLAGRDGARPRQPAQAAIDAGARRVDGEPTEPGVARALLAALARRRDARASSSSMPVPRRRVVRRSARGVRVSPTGAPTASTACVSTAVGVALASDGPTAAPDRRRGAPARHQRPARRRRPRRRPHIVVVDNDGGGIFSFLPQATAARPRRSSSSSARPTASTSPRWPPSTASPRSGGRRQRDRRAPRAGADRACRERRAHDAINRAVVDALG